MATMCQCLLQHDLQGLAMPVPPGALLGVVAEPTCANKALGFRGPLKLSCGTECGGLGVFAAV